MFRATEEQEQIVCNFLKRISPNREWTHLEETERKLIWDLVKEIYESDDGYIILDNYF